VTSAPPLILASGSRYRAELLERLGLPFRIQTSGVDETPRYGEKPAELARRLALDKARRVAAAHPSSAVIGADQVAVLGDTILGKPGGRDRAVAGLRRMSGNPVDFLSGIALVHANTERADVVPTRAKFRDLTETEIEHYVDRDRPFDCAGGLRSESLGIALLDSLTSDDPTALIGLPLIRIGHWLREVGFPVP